MGIDLTISFILAIIILGFLIIGILVGLAKGCTRTIIGFVTSSPFVFIETLLVSFLMLPFLLEGLDLTGKVASLEIAFFTEPVAFLPVLDLGVDFLGLPSNGITFLVCAVAIPFVYIVCSFVAFIEKSIFNAIFRGIRPKTLDYTFGFVIWTFICVMLAMVLASVIIILFGILHEAGVMPGITDELFADGALFRELAEIFNELFEEFGFSLPGL